MENRKININRPEPTTSDINKFKDFDQLLTDFNEMSSATQAASAGSASAKVSVAASKGLISSGWLTGIISGALLIGGVGIFALNNSGDAEENVEDVVPPKISSNTPLVTSGLVSRSGKTVSIEGNEDITIQLAEGTEMVIPYKTISYLPEGASIYWEINDGKDNSYSGKSNYCFFSVFNEEYVPLNIEGAELKSSLEVFSFSNESWNKLERSVQTQIVEKEPKKPLKADPSKYLFDIEINTKDFPEFASFQGWLFQVEDEQGVFNSGHYDVVWNDARLQRINDSEYELFLQKDDLKLNVKVVPVLQGRRFDEAISDYNKKVKEIDELNAQIKNDQKFIIDNTSQIAI